MSVLIIYVADEDSSGDSTQGVIIGVTVAMSLIVLVAASIVAGIVVIIIWNAHMKVHKYCAIRATNVLSLELSVHITNLLLTYFSRRN